MEFNPAICNEVFTILVILPLEPITLHAYAKEKLSTTDLSVSEIAYELGFEHSQSFSKLFKTKTKQSPLEFRQSFN
jgi:AraC-like DNA-binding protein